MQATENLPGTHPKEGEIHDFEINGERTLKRFNIRKATQEEIKDESCDYIYISASSGRREFKVKVLESINPKHPEIIAKPDEMPVVKGWYDPSIQP